jgi:hypothetical protein
MTSGIRRRTLGWLLCVAFCAAFAAPALAQGKGKGKGHQKDQSADDTRGRVAFSPRDQEIIRDYFRDQRSNLPPGLAKRDRLPPGLQKHLERDGTLPPGLQKRLQPFPDDLERRLPRLPVDCYCDRRVIGVDVIILARRTQIIVDIVHDVLSLRGR